MCDSSNRRAAAGGVLLRVPPAPPLPVHSLFDIGNFSGGHLNARGLTYRRESGVADLGAHPSHTRALTAWLCLTALAAYI